MSGNFLKEDIRVLKTQKSLQTAIQTLIEQKSFRQITVNDICGCALISRAAFYMHFQNKYDLLEHWLLNVVIDRYKSFSADAIIKHIFYEEVRFIKNIIKEADSETLDIVYKFTVGIFQMFIAKNGVAIKNDLTNAENMVLTNFCVGGAIWTLLWQVRHDFPPELQSTKGYLKDLFGQLFDWEYNRQNPKT